MTRPLFFGSEERRLFCLYTAPGGTPSNRGVVLCNPWGNEALSSHRSYRLLSELLARAGLHVLRFDYHGTGDSGGLFPADGLDGWIRDAIMAVEELRTLTGARRIGLVGLRLGAAVAAGVAALDRGVRQVALWDPVCDGPGWLAEVGAPEPDRPGVEAEQAGDDVGRDDVGGDDVGGDDEGGDDVGGFPLPRSLQSGIRAIDPAWYRQRVRGSVLVALSEETAQARALQDTLTDVPGLRSAEFRLIPGPRAWMEERDFGAGAVPSTLLNEVARWDW